MQTLIQREAVEFIKESALPRTKEELEGLMKEFIQLLDKEKAFTTTALHDGLCECWQGAWGCSCYKRRFPEEKK